MVNIKHEENKVLVEFSTGIGWIVIFRTERSYELDAVLLSNQLNKALREKIESIRTEAYNEGWKDKSRKNKKKTTFSSGIDSNWIGY